MGASPSKSSSADVPPCEGGRAAYEAARNASSNAESSSCPVPEEYRGNLGVYNVYNTKIATPTSGDAAGGGAEAPNAKPARRSWFGFGASALDPRNNMPTEPAQARAPGQRRDLSTARETSTIPKSGTGGTWTYPSPQMFYNALVRKNKAEDVDEADVDSVVMVHNAMNEDTWRRVAQWEKLHRYASGHPMLLRFRGRPDELSPLAMLNVATGGQRPFDRHDWYVDREGREVRYVIDYYFNEEKAGTSEQFDVVVRPALDSVDALVDRLKMNIYIGCAALGIPCPVKTFTGSREDAAGEDALSS
jgi:cytochrome c heme-lyase